MNTRRVATGDGRSSVGSYWRSGLALKVTVAWALIPFVLIVRRWPIGWRLVACLAMLGPGTRVVSPCLGKRYATRFGLIGFV